MKRFKTLKKVAFLAVLMIFFTGCEKEELNEQTFETELSAKVKVPTAEAAGNNLSFPVFWAEGVAKELRDAPLNMEGDYKLEGAWWYVWGPEPIDPASTIYSCAPSPLGEFLCLDQTVPGSDETGSDVYKAWFQKDINNYWEAFNETAIEDVKLDFIDWGDNLESIDWSIQSRVRTELVLYENVADQDYSDGVTQYPMRHISGWGTDEVHGLQTETDNSIYIPTEDVTFGKQATVYSTLTRMTIQKLNVERESLQEGDLIWNPVTAQWDDNDGNDETSLINEPILTQTVGGGDGPTFFNAEVNVKGKIIYGYTWDMKKMNEGTGDYRITYSFDSDPGLNTFITDNTIIIVPIEEEVIAEAEGETGGQGVLDPGNNLTYMDIRIVGRTTGGGGGNSGGGNGGGGNNSGGGGNGGRN